MVVFFFVLLIYIISIYLFINKTDSKLLNLEDLDLCKTIQKVNNPFEGINGENIYNINNTNFLPPIYYDYESTDNKIYININLSKLKESNMPIHININI